jgi:uncharacterized membrane protein
LTLEAAGVRPIPTRALSVHQNLPRAATAGPPISAGAQIGASALLGTALGVALASATAWWLAPVLSWDTSAAIYLLWVWLTIWRLDAERTAQLAVPADPTRAAADALLLGAAVVSLVAVALLLGRAAQAQGTTQNLYAWLGVASVVLSWGVVHTVYTLRYARLYYTGEDGGIEFNDPEPPTYVDFAYLSFTIGMTFQVSDTELNTPRIRAQVLRHALLAYLFGTVIVALTINLVAGLTK